MSALAAGSLVQSHLAHNRSGESFFVSKVRARPCSSGLAPRCHSSCYPSIANAFHFPTYNPGCPSDSNLGPHARCWTSDPRLGYLKAHPSPSLVSGAVPFNNLVRRWSPVRGFVHKSRKTRLSPPRGSLLVVLSFPSGLFSSLSPCAVLVAFAVALPPTLTSRSDWDPIIGKLRSATPPISYCSAPKRLSFLLLASA